MKVSLVLVTLLLSSVASGPTLAAAAQAEERPARVGFIDFYGYGGLDMDKVRAALPVSEGETFPTLTALFEMRPQLEEAVQRVTHRPVTDVAIVSPGEDVWLIYIGLVAARRSAFPTILRRGVWPGCRMPLWKFTGK